MNLIPKPLIVGECNPYGGLDEYALYPAPDGCSGHRLCCLIMGMCRRSYLESFDRCNLVEGKWTMKAARLRAKELWEQDRRFILLGSKACSAWEQVFEPFAIFDGGTCLVLPHPSGLCRLWQQPGAIERARAAVLTLAPELAHLIGNKAKAP